MYMYEHITSAVKREWEKINGKSSVSGFLNPEGPKFGTERVRVLKGSKPFGEKYSWIGNEVVELSTSRAEAEGLRLSTRL